MDINAKLQMREEKYALSFVAIDSRVTNIFTQTAYRNNSKFKKNHFMLD